MELMYPLPCFVVISILMLALWKAWPLYVRLTSGTKHMRKILEQVGMSSAQVHKSLWESYGEYFGIDGV